MRRPPPPDAILLDLTLPDGPGLDVLRRVRDRGLPCRVAVTTGTYDRELLAAVDLLRPERVFRKPFGLPQLKGWITTAVDAVDPPTSACESLEQVPMPS
jgi:CheY-like chemotaxis protein